MTTIVKKPDRKIAELDAIHDLARDLQQHELAVAKCRSRLNAAIVKAAASVPQAKIARAAGLSRQRVGQLCAKGNGRG